MGSQRVVSDDMKRQEIDAVCLAHLFPLAYIVVRDGIVCMIDDVFPILAFLHTRPGMLNNDLFDHADPIVVYDV